MLFIRSTLLHIFMAVTTIITATTAILLVPLPYVFRYSVINVYAHTNIWLMQHLNGFDYTIEGSENLPDKHTPVIIFSKHQSTWETFALQTIFHRISFIFKQELFYIPFFGWGLAAMKPVAIKRGSGHVAVNALVTNGTKRLKEGISIVIFPEGTRTQPTGPGRYRIGGAVLAAESGYPVIPVAHNAGECWPRKSWMLYPGKITVRIGPAIETTGKQADEILAEAKTWIEAQMPAITRGVYSSD